MAQDFIKIYFDGGSRGNPGPAAGAAYADFEGGRERACFIESATNNEAEYRGLLMAIELAHSLGLSHAEFLGDSKLVVMQVTGEWQAKHAMMSDLRREVLAALTPLVQWRLRWIPRELNAQADRVANEELDRQQGLVPIIAQPRPSLVRTDGPVVPSAAAIARLNELGAKAGFGDLQKLRVGGTDAYSRASLVSLAEALPHLAELQLAFTDRLHVDKQTRELSEDVKAKLLLNALRWSARGLLGDLALRKILVDLELADRMRKKSKASAP